MRPTTPPSQTTSESIEVTLGRHVASRAICEISVRLHSLLGSIGVECPSPRAAEIRLQALAALAGTIVGAGITGASQDGMGEEFQAALNEAMDLAARRARGEIE